MPVLNSKFMILNLELKYFLWTIDAFNFYLYNIDFLITWINN